jgi:mobilization protein NikA
MDVTDTSARCRREKRAKILRVVVSDTEAGHIAAYAQGTGLSVSHYLRNLGLGDPPQSQLDRQLVLELIKINGDQGRLGGLLKLWLSTRPGEGASAFDVRSVLREIEATQALLKTAARRL